MKILERGKYLDRIQEQRKDHKIILLTGLHGSGKSLQLSSIAKLLRSEKPTVKIVQLSGGIDIETGRELLASARALGAGPSALCLDNAERIEELPSALSEIIQKYAVTVFVSGAKTVTLETSLTEAFRGTLAVVRINPFSYREFLDSRGLADSRRALELYSHNGGLPESGMIAPDAEEMYALLSLRADSFILTEIIETHSIRNPSHIRQLLCLVSRSTGEHLSARKVCAAFAKTRTTISPQAALDYLSFCSGSGLLLHIPVLDIRAKKILETGSVWYFGDTGLRSAFVKKESGENLARALENLVLLHLLDQGWTVYRGRIDTGGLNSEEITFVCERNGEKKYIQMPGHDAGSGEKIRKREALLSVRDAWPKFMVEAEAGPDESDGIRTIFIRDLLFSV